MSKKTIYTPERISAFPTKKNSAMKSIPDGGRGKGILNIEKTSYKGEGREDRDYGIFDHDALPDT